MCRIGKREVFALLMVVCTGFGGKWGVVGGGSSVTNTEDTLIKNWSNASYLVEGGDYVDLSRWKNERERLDDYEVAGEVGADWENRTASEGVMRKCCAWNQYLDAEGLICVTEGAGNVSWAEILKGRTVGERVGRSGEAWAEGMPECDVQSVAVVVSISRVSVGVSGLAIEGEGVFPKYCIDGDPKEPGRTVAIVCRDAATYCGGRTCYRKCCPLGYAYKQSERKCERTEEPWRVVFYNLSTLSRAESPGAEEWGLYVLDACGSRGKFLLEREMGEISYLGLDGVLLVPAFEKRFSVADFCVEFVTTVNSSTMESFLCFTKGMPRFENSPLQFFLLSLGFIISCMFLLFTFLVYLFSPKSRNLYGKTLMCYIACLFTAYLCLAIIELQSKELDRTVCTRMGYFLLFAFLAAFFWLNVISFDIWKAFRSNRGVERSKAGGRKLRFLVYSLYAWGFPATITSLCAYANELEHSAFEILRPDIGVENCWFSKKQKGIYVFFIGPISVMIAVNIVFYVETAWKIWKVRSEVKKMEKHKTRRFSANKEQFVINGKLFIVMGITWSLEIISFFAPHPIWYITDTANALHGVFIFAVFVLKKKVLRQVSEQVRAPLKRMRELTGSNSVDLSTRKNVIVECNVEDGKVVESQSCSGETNVGQKRS